MSSNLFEEGGGEVPSFNSHISQHPLLVGFLQNVLLHRALTDQPAEGKTTTRSVYCTSNGKRVVTASAERSARSSRTALRPDL